MGRDSGPVWVAEKAQIVVDAGCTRPLGVGKERDPHNLTVAGRNRQGKVFHGDRNRDLLVDRTREKGESENNNAGRRRRDRR